jgi:hypothetical protein
MCEGGHLQQGRTTEMKRNADVRLSVFRRVIADRQVPAKEKA